MVYSNMVFSYVRKRVHDDIGKGKIYILIIFGED